VDTADMRAAEQWT